MFRPGLPSRELEPLVHTASERERRCGLKPPPACLAALLQVPGESSWYKPSSHSHSSGRVQQPAEAVGEQQQGQQEESSDCAPSNDQLHQGTYEYDIENTSSMYEYYFNVIINIIISDDDDGDGGGGGENRATNTYF